jgi:squalene-hopene/tetraprenyl-beta-curcumene cyclase
MNLEVDVERLTLAHKAVRAELLAERAAGHWVGQIGSSPFATAAAVSALVTAHRRSSQSVLQANAAGDGQIIEQVVQGDLSELFVESTHCLARQQNADGGWGDCVGARSNIATTMMVQAAFRLTGIPAKYADLMVRADDYVTAQEGVAGLRRHCGRDKPLFAAIMANCALADMVPWRQVPTLQFEIACLPNRWQREVQIFAPRHATPLILAVGRAKYHHDPPKNPITRLLRRSMRCKSLAALERLQAEDDSFLASIPVTAFVVMNLSSIDCQDHAIVRRGIEFLLSSIRADSSWSLTPNFAIANTALAWNSLSAQPAARSEHAWHSLESEHLADDHDHSGFSEACCDWLLRAQRIKPNLVTDAPAGGWASADAAGSLPNTIATASSLVALTSLRRDCPPLQQQRAEAAIRRGVAWLLDMQNPDGGWPTFYREDTLLRFDESATDTTSQVLRALATARKDSPAATSAGIERAIENSWQYLESQQRDDGSFIPMWFGNVHQPDNHNPVYGTAQALLASADLERLDSNTAERAARWLVVSQHAGGGWGPPRSPVDYSGSDKDRVGGRRANEAMAQFCTVEETSLAVSALIPLADTNPAIAKAVSKGLAWLIRAIEQDKHRQPAIIGLSRAKLWYDERLYPLAFAAGALTRAVRSVTTRTPTASHV